MLSDSWATKAPLVPFGEEYVRPQGGVAACMVWNQGSKYSLRPPQLQTPQLQTYPLRSSIKQPNEYLDRRLAETEYNIPDGALPTRYVPTPPPPQNRSYHRALDSYRDRATPLEDTSIRTYRPYTPGMDQDIGIMGDSMHPYPPDAYRSMGPKPPLHPHTTPRSHRACHVTTKDVFLLNKAREEYERSLQDGFIRDKGLESRLYGFNPRELERSRPGSAARNYRLATPGGRRPHTSVGILDENYQDVHVTWHPDVPDSTRSRALQSTHPSHFNEWRHLTAPLANSDSYVDDNGRVVRAVRNHRTYNNSQRDNYGYWKMNKFTKNAKSKVSTHWQPPSENPAKVNMQLDCPDDSDMLVSFRVRSAKM